MKSFAAIDFETANSRRSSVCSVGVVIVRDGEIVDRFCTLTASRRQLPGLSDHRLDTVAAACGYDMTHHHHALADAEACAEIAKVLF